MTANTENLIRSTDFAVFIKGMRREWIAYPESGRIYSTTIKDFIKTDLCSGYQTISFRFSYGGQQMNTRIPFHRALWVLCRGIPLSLRAEVDHIDGNKENNTIDNLRLISKEENTPHKLSFEIAEEIRRRYAEGETKAALGREFGVSQKAIYHIIYRRTYRHPPEKMYYRGRV